MSPTSQALGYPAPSQFSASSLAAVATSDLSPSQHLVGYLNVPSLCCGPKRT